MMGGDAGGGPGGGPGMHGGAAHGGGGTGGFQDNQPSGIELAEYVKSMSMRQSSPSNFTGIANSDFFSLIVSYQI